MNTHLKSIDAGPGIFIVPIGDQWLLHAPLHGISALLNRAALNVLREGIPAATDDLRALQAALAAPARPWPAPAVGGPNPDFLGIVTTRACNMMCPYCAFGAAGDAPKRLLDPALAQATIEWFADLLVQQGRTCLDVRFFWGRTAVRAGRCRGGRSPCAGCGAPKRPGGAPGDQHQRILR